MTTEIAPAWTPTGRSLAENETIIARGIDGFIETGIALADVRETGQYREAGFDSFTAYLAGRWPKLTRSMAYRAIDGARVSVMLSPIGDKLPNEAQARELAPLRDDQDAMRDAWDTAVQRSNGEPTAGVIREIVQQHKADLSQAEDEAFTQAVLERTPEGREFLDRQKRREFIGYYRKKQAAIWDLVSLRPEAVAEAIEQSKETAQEWSALAYARNRLTEWTAEVEALRPHGLHAVRVKGGKPSRSGWKDLREYLLDELAPYLEGQPDGKEHAHTLRVLVACVAA